MRFTAVTSSIIFQYHIRINNVGEIRLSVAYVWRYAVVNNGQLSATGTLCTALFLPESLHNEPILTQITKQRSNNVRL